MKFHNTRATLTRWLLRGVEALNSTKDEALSCELHDLSFAYERRPGERCASMFSAAIYGSKSCDCAESVPVVTGVYSARTDGAEPEDFPPYDSLICNLCGGRYLFLLRKPPKEAGRKAVAKPSRPDFGARLKNVENPQLYGD